MKLQGRKPSGVREELLVLPRPEGDFAFKFRAVMEDYPEPPPEPVRKNIKGAIVQDRNDPEFTVLLDAWATRKTHWHFLTSISATDGLEWETVDMAKPETYNKWEQELKDDGFNDGERALIFQTYQKANFLSEAMLEEARKRFLALPEVTQAGSLSGTSVLPTI